MATAKVQLRAQEARINDQLDHTAEEQEELLNEQLHVQEELTKQDIKEQREAICRLQKDVVDDITLIGATILKHVLAENVVPRDAFKGAKGAVFLQAAYAAAGVTAFRGQGFVVAAVNGQWSAPSFLSLSSLGVGLSLGGEMVDTIAILYRDEDVDKYKEGDFRITSYRTGIPVVSTLGAMGCADMQPAVYTAKSGKLLDYSINGGTITHAKAANAKAYGALVSPEDILSGRIDSPASLDPVYKELTALSRSATSPEQ
ncbi:hypothetical protein WJX75_001246 [Coccomyxa subellipsoidea]|uniref:Ysc84 actin-binding domain-containing protein n=1 Tax=Coccomyxa subellipsoidea TaxID=248742 RepID=A0ABR2YDG6_9CHLO